MGQIDFSISHRIMAEAREQGLRHFFGLPGGGVPLEMIDAGHRAGIDFVSVAHESSAAIMAGYYGLMKGTAGLALAIRGVGAGNLAGGIVNAFFERLPLIAVCEVNPGFLGQLDRSAALRSELPVRRDRQIAGRPRRVKRRGADARRFPCGG